MQPKAINLAAKRSREYFSQISILLTWTEVIPTFSSKTLVIHIGLNLVIVNLETLLGIIINLKTKILIWKQK